VLPNEDYNRTCSPLVESFTPTSGPVEGGTVLHFDGKYFGHSFVGYKELFVITVGNRKYSIIERKENSLKCRIESNKLTDEKPSSVDVILELNMNEFNWKNGSSHDSNYYIKVFNGKFMMEEKFQFETPEIFGIFPSHGPYNGGTRIVIYGNHLDIGKTNSVQIGNTEEMDCVSFV